MQGTQSTVTKTYLTNLTDQFDLLLSKIKFHQVYNTDILLHFIFYSGSVTYFDSFRVKPRKFCI